MRRVVIESPFAGTSRFRLVRWLQRLLNVRYARRCLRDALERGESPIASHLLLTQPGVLDDDVPDERQRGIAAGLEWGAVADAHVFYLDRGMSPGMHTAFERCRSAGRRMDCRYLDKEPADQAFALALSRSGAASEEN